jgi:exopolysaccharide production protein ExoZ
MQKIQNIQTLRGIAVLLVVLFHMMIVEKKYGGSVSLLPDVFWFGNFGVDLFFVISGFVMVTVTHGKFQNLKQSLMFLYHRTSRIYPLYWVYTLTALAVFLIQPTWVNSAQDGQVDILASFLLLPSKLLPLVQVGWTLIHEMYFYLVFFVIFLLLPEKFFSFAILLWGGLLAMLNWLDLPATPAYNVIIHPLTMEFIGGCLLAVMHHKSKPLNIRGGWLVSAAAAALVISIAGHIIHGEIIPVNWWRVLIYGVPAMFIVYFITNAERNGTVLPSALIHVGNASYSIYLSHLFTINVVGRIWAVFAVNQTHDNFIVLPIMLAVTIFVGFVSYWLVEIPLLRLSRRLV